MKLGSALSPSKIFEPGNVSVGYDFWFAEGKTVETFKPQSCKG